MPRDLDVGGDGREVERLTDEVAERCHEFRRVDRAARGHIGRGLSGQADVFFCAEQNNVGEGGLDGVTDAAGAFGGLLCDIALFLGALL